MNVGPAHYLVLSALVFGIGLFGVLSRRSVIAGLASLSLLFGAPVIGAVGVAESGSGFVPATGDVFALLIIVALCSQLVVGGAVAALVWRRADTADLDELSELDSS